MEKLLIIIFALTYTSLNSQQDSQVITNKFLALTNKNISELFFGLQKYPTKYDVRKLFHSDGNFLNLGGYDYGGYETIDAEFSQNFKMSYLGRDVKKIIFWFNNETDVSDSRKIYTEYYADEHDLCLKQFNEIYDIFKKSSFKFGRASLSNSTGENAGEGWDFYSSPKSVKLKKPYLSMNYRHFNIKVDPSIYTKEKSEGYIFEVVFTDKNLF